MGAETLSFFSSSSARMAAPVDFFVIDPRLGGVALRSERRRLGSLGGLRPGWPYRHERDGQKGQRHGDDVSRYHVALHFSRALQLSSTFQRKRWSERLRSRWIGLKLKAMTRPLPAGRSRMAGPAP